MNKSILLALFFCSSHLALASPASPPLSAREIMQKNEQARQINELKTEAKISSGTENPGGKTTEEKVKDFTFWRKLQKDGIHNSTLTRFHAPAEVKEEGILIVENSTGRNDVLLYLPNFKKIRRVESQQQSGSFMGSVFSYSDIASPHVDDYQYTILKEEKCPTTEPTQNMCTIVESTPANDDVKERTQYSRSVLWIRQDNFMMAKSEYFDLTGTLFKKLEASETVIADPKNKKWISKRIHVLNTKTHEYTTLEFSNIQVNSGISDSLFTQQNLQKVN